MNTKRSALIASIILFVLFMILLVFSLIAGSYDLGLLSAVALLSGFLAFVDYMGKHPLDRQNLYVGICFYLFAFAEFLIFMKDGYSDKSRIGWIAYGILFGTYQFIKYRQITHKEDTD